MGCWGQACGQVKRVAGGRKCGWWTEVWLVVESMAGGRKCGWWSEVWLVVERSEPPAVVAPSSTQSHPY